MSPDHVGVIRQDRLWGVAPNEEVERARPGGCVRSNNVPKTHRRKQRAMPMSLSLKNLLPILALILGVAALVAPRFLNILVAIFLIAFAVVGLGLIR
jgi:hypothetical protein